MMPKPPGVPLKARLLYLLYRLGGCGGNLDYFLSTKLRHRRHLPELYAHEVIPGFNESEIRLTHSPLGSWSAPMGDLFVLLKAVVGFKAKRILEIGSYRGDTARSIAENIPDDARVCAVDIDPRHGAAYRNTPWERKIDRRTAAFSRDVFEPNEKFDLIFIDGNHEFDAVVHDTAVAFELVAEQGVILWHDYTDATYFSGLSRVPEALEQFTQKHAIISISGTTLAVWSNVKGWDTREILAKHSGKQKKLSAWEEEQVRG
jgi:predicted O-methyltransferase YrrM